MPIPHARRMNVIALALLITGLISLIASQLLVFADLRPDAKVLRGWHIWPEIWTTMRSPDFHTRGLIYTSSFLASLLLVVGAPFAISVLRASRLARCFAATVSGMSLIGLSVSLYVVYSNASLLEKLGPGYDCLVASQALNLLGLLIIRPEASADLS